MAKSKIEITFNSNPLEDSYLYINNNLSAININEIFVNTRTGNGESEIETELEPIVTTLNYFQAVTADYNNTGLYNILVLNNVVTIEAIQNNVIFSVIENTTGGAVTTIITNEVVTPSLSIDSVTFSQADTNICNNVKVNVTTNELATKVTSPLLIDPNTNNPFSFDWIRGVNINIACENATGSVNANFELPSILSEPTTNINIFNTPTGANITITHESNNGLVLEYSLDNVIWQTSNVFNGILEGNHTVYVRDQLGCNISKDFEVTVFTPSTGLTSPFFLLSKSMSFRFKRDVLFDNCGNYKNEENTLACEYKTLLPYPELQQFQTCDIIKTQFKSNSDDITVNIIKEDETKNLLTLDKKTSNLNKKDKRDSTYYNLGNGQTGIYFTSGNTYDYDTGIVNGTYALNGKLPEWGVIGGYVFLDSIGWFEIKEISFNNNANADVLVIDYEYTGIPTSIIASANYNLFNFEIYEFEIDLLNYANQIIQIEILNNDTVFENNRYLSEKIEIVDEVDDSLFLTYYNDTNTDVFYSTGIKNKIRLQYDNFQPNIDPELENLKTDTNAILIDSKIYETNVLVTKPLTVAMMRQLTQAVLHENLFIDGVKYIASEPPEIENYGQTNLSVVTVTLIKDGNVYNSTDEGIPTEIVTGSELIGLLQNEGKYIKLH